MMQFTTTSTTPTPTTTTITPPNIPPILLCNNLPIMNKTQLNRGHHHHRPWPGGFPTSKALGTSFGDANCMEQLLVHCANAIETNDVTLAQQILWVLNNIAQPDGDSNQRLTSAFLRALITRAARIGTSCIKMLASAVAVQTQNDDNLNVVFDVPHRFSVIDFATFIDLTPWHRFGFTAANAAILEAVEGFSLNSLHADPNLTRRHCLPTLRVVAAEANDVVPPILDISYDELGLKLVNFARSRNIILEFRLVHSTYSDGFASLIEHLRLQQQQLRSAFNFLWIPYDTVETFLPKGSKQRQWYEADIGWKIENVIANEGVQRVERLEPKSRWVQRMRNASFRSVGFGEEAVSEVKTMLDEHAAGWGLKKEDEDHLVLTWKGHNVVFATLWMPAAVALTTTN
ncbi:hypothetical protein G4B88_017524 [Cannabis sativa]|uniref:Scarecrow-like protein 32 n=1 Tax=Cannabis sativa TaxID=3483 RepID=A0A7J6I377_CANSA|nr:hypothetical protein G4B88_017524 [Cannabis sativa]